MFWLFLKLLKLFSLYEGTSAMWSKLSIGLHVKYPLFLSDFNGTSFCSTDFRNINNKFRENPSCGSPVVPWGQTDRQTDMTKLRVTFRNFANAPEHWRDSFAYFSLTLWITSPIDIGRTIWTDCRPIARPLSTKNKKIHKHNTYPCSKRDLSSRNQFSRVWRWDSRPPWSPYSPASISFPLLI